MLRNSLPLLLASLAAATIGAAISAADERQEELDKKFQKSLSGARLVGHFTIDGKEDPPKKETYTIKKVTRLDIDDLWRFDVHMKYGDVDRSVAMALPVKWAGDTPVISLSKTAIPNLGTFSARVVIDGDRYAGTWTHHDRAGGHMFGMIEKEEVE